MLVSLPRWLCVALRGVAAATCRCLPLLWKQMRMPSPHLLLDRPRHVFRSERSLLLADHDLKSEMQHEIAQLVLDFLDGGGGDSVVQLEGFLDEIRTQGC